MMNNSAEPGGLTQLREFSPMRKICHANQVHVVPLMDYRSDSKQMIRRSTPDDFLATQHSELGMLHDMILQQRFN